MCYLVFPYDSKSAHAQINFEKIWLTLGHLLFYLKYMHEYIQNELSFHFYFDSNQVGLHIRQWSYNASKEMEISSFNPTKVLSFSISSFTLHEENYVEVSEKLSKITVA